LVLYFESVMISISRVILSFFSLHSLIIFTISSYNCRLHIFTNVYSFFTDGLRVESIRTKPSTRTVAVWYPTRANIWTVTVAHAISANALRTRYSWSSRTRMRSDT
jgi:hypothetical protein